MAPDAKPAASLKQSQIQALGVATQTPPIRIDWPAMDIVENPVRAWKRRGIALAIFAASCGGWWLLTTFGKLIPEWVGIPFMLGLFVSTFGCGAIARRILPVIHVPIDPATWNKTMDDLEAEHRAGQRATISDEERRLARDYELGQLPPDTIFPAAGQIWEAVEDTPVTYIIWYKAPYSDGGEAVLPKGERLVIDRRATGPSIHASCEALRHAEMESVLIPAHTRNSRKYSDYGLMIRTAVLNRCCRLVESQ